MSEYLENLMNPEEQVTEATLTYGPNFNNLIVFNLQPVGCRLSVLEINYYETANPIFDFKLGGNENYGTHLGGLDFEDVNPYWQSVFDMAGISSYDASTTWSEVYTYINDGQNIQDNPWIIIPGKSKLIVVCFDDTIFPNIYPMCSYIADMNMFITSANICTWNGDIIPVSINYAGGDVMPWKEQDQANSTQLYGPDDGGLPIKLDTTLFSSADRAINEPRRAKDKKEKLLNSKYSRKRSGPPKIRKDKQNLLNKLRAFVNLGSLKSRRFATISPKKIEIPPAKGEAEIKPLDVGSESGTASWKVTDSEGGTE